MSDTDDTDDLLLIPPDFFNISTALEDPLKPYAPYYNIVDNLITQFHSLEDRINHIEATSDNSFMNSSLDSPNFMTSGIKRFNSLNDLATKPTGSTQSTPQKPKSQTQQNSLPSSPNVDNLQVTRRRQYGRQQRSPTTSQTTSSLDEINNFISHVKNIQKHDTARNLSLLFESIRKNGEVQASEPIAVKESSWKAGDTKGSVPNYNMGMRELLYKDSKNVPELSLPSIDSHDISSASSSESTQLTTVNRHTSKIHVRALDVLDKHRDLLSQTNSSPETTERREKHTAQQRKLVMMSLSELWNQDCIGAAGDYSNQENLKYQSRLQEEKLRRQHCEELIHRLQSKNLELQQRVAVAIQVDEAKDDAILQIHKSWEESATKIDNLQKDKTQLELQLIESNSKTSAELLEATKKVAHYESESSKALNLAHSNQEKVAALEKQNIALQADAQLYEDKFRKLEMDFEHEHNHNQQLSQLLGQKEVELNENKTIQIQATQEIAQSKRAVELCQAELTAIKGRQTQLETRYNETLSQIKELEGDKKKLAGAIENNKKTEKHLKDELSRIKETNEQGKAELRTYYQNQVEILVREKLKEFQQQLEKAEGSLNEEMHLRELSIAKNAAVHIQQINEKNILEIHLLQEKHKEEIKLYKLQVFQAQQEISNLQTNLQQQQERRANIVHQLQKVMEAQWSEALKIINNVKTPVVPQDKSTSTIDQLNHLKSRSYNNLEELLLRDEGSIAKKLAIHKASGSFAPSGKLVENIFQDETMETPVSSKNDRNKQHGDNEIQKYIQMLLSKQPGHPLEDQLSKQQEFYENQSQLDASKLKGLKDRFGKPPWK